MIELGAYVRDVIKLNMDARNFRIFGPDETMSNRLQPMFRGHRPRLERMSVGHRRIPGPQRPRHGRHAVRAFVRGLARGLSADRPSRLLSHSYEAFIRIVDSMVAQHAKWLKVCNELPWRQAIASLNLILASNVWQQDHNGFTHQDPAFLDHIANKKADVVRLYLPPDANCLLSCFDHCIKSRNYVNVIVAIQAPASPVADHGAGRASTALRASASGSGPPTIRAQSRTLLWPAAATRPRWKRWLP